MKQNSYLLLSSSRAILDQKIESIIKERDFLDASVNTYDLEEDTLDMVLEDIDTISFLTPKKVVIARNAKFLESGGKEDEKSLSHLLKYLDHQEESVLFFLLVKKLDERKKIGKELKKKMNTISLTPDARSYIKSLLKGYEIDNYSLTLLLEYTKEDYDKLFMESEKLKNYCYETKKITKDAIMELVKREEDDQDKLAFSLSRSILEKNKKEAFKAYKRLESYQVEPYSILGLLESQYRLLYQIKELEKQGLRKDEIAKYLEIHPFRVQKTMEVTRFYSKKEIASFLFSLAQVDYRIKSGKIDSNMAIELLILNQ